MENEKQAIMVEWIDDTNTWAWYAVFENSTIEKALRICLAENECDKTQAIKEERDGYYTADDNFRAYHFNIRILK